MSIAVQKWAWDQNIPNVAAKFLLVTMADQADLRDGAVRHQDTTAEFFSQKCSISKSTFWRAVAVLEQNGYLRREAHQGRVTDYWLCLERGLSSTDEWSDDDTRVNLRRVADSDPCHQRNEPVSPAQLTRVTADTTNNQTTKETNARARARVKAHAPTLKEKPEEQFVIHGTRHWRDLEEYRERRGQTMPKFHHRGEGEHVNHTGRWFAKAEWRAALSEARATGPPDAIDPCDTLTDDGNEPGEANEQSQSFQQSEVRL